MNVKEIYIFILLVNVCPVWFQVDKTCNSPVTSSCENSFRVKCPSSLPLVSGSVWHSHTGCIYLFHIFHCDERSKETLFSCHTIPAHPVCGIHCILSCMCAAGLFQRLLRPRWGCATKTAGDDGEQQLRVSNSRLRQNNWCVHRPYLVTMYIICPLLSIIYCTHLVVFL